MRWGWDRERGQVICMFSVYIYIPADTDLKISDFKPDAVINGGFEASGWDENIFHAEL